MWQKVLLVLGHICSIPILVVIVQNKGRADSIRWNAFESTTTTYEVNEVDWKNQEPTPPAIDKNKIIWTEVKNSNDPANQSNQIIWKEISEKQSNLSDEEIAEQSSPYSIKPVGNAPSPLQALDRSIAFKDGFVGPDVSWNIPNGLRWSERWSGSFSLLGGDSTSIVHNNILQLHNWSVGLNASIRNGIPIPTDSGTSSKILEGFSSGFRIATALSDTSGIAFGGEQVLQWDNNNDKGRNLYLMATKGWWIGDHGNDYPLLIANGGLGTGRFSNQDASTQWINPLRFACIKDFDNGNGTFSYDKDLCWSPIGSVSIVFNDYVSSFIEYYSGTAHVAGSISMNDGIPLRFTWGVDFVRQNKIVEPDNLRWFFKASIGF